MSTRNAAYSTSGNDFIRRLVVTGLITGVIDGLFSSTLSVAFYNSTMSRLFQGVASVLLGSDAFNGGNTTTAIGVLMHFGVAFLWSGIFIVLILRWRWIRRVLATQYGAAKIASLYGPLIWTVMSLAVIPAFTHRLPAITVRWWIQFFGHILFVGLPIVAISTMRRPSPVNKRES
jgi:hypothetical protein